MKGSYYQTLGVSVNATAEELRKALEFRKSISFIDIADWH